MQLLNNFLKGIFLPLFLFSAVLNKNYFPIYDKKNLSFVYSIENGNYKLILSTKNRIDYSLFKGFSFFIPQYTKSFDLQILRYNSIGYINGYLAVRKELFPNQIISSNPTNLKFYYTDYKKGYRGLDYILNGKGIFYQKVTSLSVEAYNIPLNKRLNKTFYFTFVKNIKGNKLKYLLYSFTIVLDKKSIDSFVKRNHFKIQNYKDKKFNYLHTFLLSLDSKNLKKLLYSKQKYYSKKLKVNPKIYLSKNYKPHIDIKKGVENKKRKKIKNRIKKKKVLNSKKLPYHLDTKKLFYMLDFKLPVNRLEFNETIKIPEYILKDIKSSLDSTKENIKNLQHYLNQKLDTKVLFFPKKILKIANNYFYGVENLDNILITLQKIEIEPIKIKCFFNENKIDKNCFNNSDYFYKYIYYLTAQNQIPLTELILGFGDYRVFNRVGIYYFNNGDFEKAKRYFFKAYSLATKRDKWLVAHNLATLFYFDNSSQNREKIINYLKKSGLGVDYFNLGVYYYLGYGVKESDVKAREFFEKSAKLGFKKGVKNFEIMKKYRIGLKGKK